MNQHPLTLLVLTLALLLVGCQTTRPETTRQQGTPPPDLTDRPWGISGEVLALAETQDIQALAQYLANPSEAAPIAEQIVGMKRSKESVSPRRAMVHIQKEDKTGVLNFIKTSNGWLLESYRLVDSGLDT